MHSFDASFKARLLKKIAEQTNIQAEQLVLGQWTGDKEMSRVGGEYLKRVGYLHALRDVAALMDDVEREINEA